MEHNYIEVEEIPAVKQMVLHQKDNNLDRLDNLDELPAEAAVYAICGRVNGKPANARFVGVSANLQASVKEHFKGLPEGKECFKQFMQSIKTKVIVYELLSGAEDPEQKRNEWQRNFKPDCNEVLNEIH